MGAKVKLDKNLCRMCQQKPIEYRTTVTGLPLKHGKCRECHERKAGWSQVGGKKEGDYNDVSFIERMAEERIAQL